MKNAAQDDTSQVLSVCTEIDDMALLDRSFPMERVHRQMAHAMAQEIMNKHCNLLAVSKPGHNFPGHCYSTRFEMRLHVFTPEQLKSFKRQVELDVAPTERQIQERINKAVAAAEAKVKSDISKNLGLTPQVDTLPTLSVDLVRGLDEIFPASTPNPDQSIADIMYRAGQRSVVNKLLSLINSNVEDEMS